MKRNYDLVNPLDCVRCVARERFAFPGGYELCLVMDDGALLCSSCVRGEYRNIIDSTKKEISDGWRGMAIVNECELEYDYCSHCTKPLGYHDEEELDEC